VLPAAFALASASAVRAKLTADTVRALFVRHVTSDQVESYPEVIRQAAAASLARVAMHPVCSAATAAAVHAAFMHARNGHKNNPVTRWSCLVALQRMEAADLLADALASY
jgi:hypothetical protein